MESAAEKIGPSLLSNKPTRPKERIRVLIADSTHIEGELLKTALTHQRTLLAEFSPNNYTDVLSAAKSLDPHVLLLSCGFDSHGMSLLQRVASAFPLVPIVVLVDNCSESTVVEAFRLGARGVFRRSESLAQLLKCISAIHQGQIWASSADLVAVLRTFASIDRGPIVKADGSPILAPREDQVARLTAEGLSNREIGDRLSISEHTVKNYLFKIYDKLGVSSRIELILFLTSHRSVSNQSSDWPQMGGT